MNPAIRRISNAITTNSLQYEAVVFSGGEFVPSTLTTPVFKGIYVTVAGDVAIVDINGNESILPVAIGFNALGGVSINEADTDATGLFVYA